MKQISDFNYMRIEDKKDWLNHDDKLYSILSKKIMIEMNKYKMQISFKNYK